MRRACLQVMFVYESSYSTHTNQNVNLSPFTMGYVSGKTILNVLVHL